MDPTAPAGPWATQVCSFCVVVVTSDLLHLVLCQLQASRLGARQTLRPSTDVVEGRSGCSQEALTYGANDLRTLLTLGKATAMQ